MIVYTVKIYHSKKAMSADDSWRHLQVRLAPDSDDPSFRELIFEADSVDGVRIVAELVAVL